MPALTPASLRVIFVSTLFWVAACGSDDGGSRIAVTVPQIETPTTASVAERESTLDFNDDAALSPSGQAVAVPVDGQWCLEDSSGVRCVDALAEGSAAHGVVWRPDETAIAVTWGAQDPISIIDFAAGTSVETDLDRHRLLAFSPDGESLLGLDIEKQDQLSLIDPVTLEADKFAGEFDGGVPQLMWASSGLVWGSSPGEPSVFTLSEGEEPEIIEGGLGEQLLVSVTPDARYALTMDDDLRYGVGEADDTILNIFDRVDARSVGVVLPPDIEQRAPSTAQLSADGRSLLVLHDVAGGLALSSASVDPATLNTTMWTKLASWQQDDPQLPAGYRSNGSMRWGGGTTATILTEQGTVLEITLN